MRPEPTVAARDDAAGADRPRDAGLIHWPEGEPAEGSVVRAAHDLMGTGLFDDDALIDLFDRHVQGRRAEQVEAALQEAVAGEVRVAVGQPGQQRAAISINTYGIRVLVE